MAQDFNAYISPKVDDFSNFEKEAGLFREECLLSLCRAVPNIKSVLSKEDLVFFCKKTMDFLTTKEIN